MGNTNLERSIRCASARPSGSRSGEELQRARLEAGLSIRRVGRERASTRATSAGSELGPSALSQDALVAVAQSVGHDASVRLYPSSGPRVRDHVQVRMLEALLRALIRAGSAASRCPSIGRCAASSTSCLDDASPTSSFPAKAHSALHAVDAQVRWAAQKTDALPSATGWPWGIDGDPARSRLLLLRDTAANRALVGSAAAMFRAAYPGSYRRGPPGAHGIRSMAGLGDRLGPPRRLGQQAAPQRADTQVLTAERRTVMICPCRTTRTA